MTAMSLCLFEQPLPLSLTSKPLKSLVRLQSYGKEAELLNKNSSIIKEKSSASGSSEAVFRPNVVNAF